MEKIGMMVGELMVSYVFDRLADKVLLLLEDRYDQFTADKTMVEDVKARLPRIRAVIQAAEGRPIRDQALATWLRELHEGEGLRTLNRLGIDGIILLQNLWILLGSLPSLQYLHIHSIYDITNFTGEQGLWFQQLTSLQELEISSCQNLESLPTSLVNFSSIRRLTINFCPKISFQSLRENELPTSLEELQIMECPLLNNRCLRGGADWPKIANIPFIFIDGKIIQKP